MSLMRIRERAAQRGSQAFRKPASWGRAWAYGLGAALLVAVSVATDRWTGVFFAFIMALVAADNVRRLREKLLPRRFRCPACTAHIVLKMAEREGSSFSCSRCGESFEVENESEAVQHRAEADGGPEADC